MNAKTVLLTGLMAAGAMPTFAASAGVAETAPVGQQSNVTFTLYSPLSRSAEIVRRLLSPLAAASVMQASMRPGKRLREQGIDLSREHFAVYVPPHAPSSGYSLLVFVPPWDDAMVPTQWTSTLERHGMIFVSAAHSGNAANVIDRREPLALLAAENIMSRYSVDPQRVYVGGFSGGARVAERLAVGYPDLFHGVLLDAGSDPLGSAQFPLPPAQLFRQFQEYTRVIYATGEHDEYHLALDAQSRQSMQDWCVFDVVTATIAFKSHDLPDAPSFDRLLDALVNPRPSDANKLAECRARIDKDLNARLDEVQGLIRSGKLDRAQHTLDKIDARFGGLAAPRSVDLASVWMQIP
jgi:pimeloyl-ACP methyl ester carboxylesterase